MILLVHGAQDTKLSDTNRPGSHSKAMGHERGLGRVGYAVARAELRHLIMIRDASGRRDVEELYNSDNQLL